MNEHVLWIFLCIQYENSCFRVYKTKRLLCSVFNGLVYSLPSMATHLPYLPGSTLYMSTSFVLPIHNPGVSLAPRQGLALWNLFLPTTRSFFVFITDLLSVTASFRWTFPITVCFLHPFTMIFFSYATFNCGLLISCSIFAPS